MGGRFVKVVGGHQDRGYLREGMTVQGQAAPGIDAAMDKMDKLMASAQVMLDGINTIVGDPAAQKNVKRSLNNFDAISENLTILTRTILSKKDTSTGDTNCQSDTGCHVADEFYAIPAEW